MFCKIHKSLVEMPVIPGLLSFRSISISLQRWTKWCRHQQCQPLRGDMSMVAFDMPPARGVPGTLVEPSLNPQQRTETYPNTAHSTRLLKPQFFHFSPFLVTWLSANRYIFPSQCLILIPFHSTMLPLPFSHHRSQKLQLPYKHWIATVGRTKQKELVVREGFIQ